MCITIKKEYFSHGVHELWLMTLTFKYDLDSVKMNQHANYIGQSSFSSKVIIHAHKHTHPTNCSIWTIKLVGKQYKY